VPVPPNIASEDEEELPQPTTDVPTESEEELADTLPIVVNTPKESFIESQAFDESELPSQPAVVSKTTEETPKSTTLMHYGSVAKVKLDKNRTVAARLDRLECCQADFLQCLSDIALIKRQIETNPSLESVEDISTRLGEVEAFLQGFDEVDDRISQVKEEEQIEVESVQVVGQASSDFHMSLIVDGQPDRYTSDKACIDTDTGDASEVIGGLPSNETNTIVDAADVDAADNDAALECGICDSMSSEKTMDESAIDGCDCPSAKEVKDDTIQDNDCNDGDEISIVLSNIPSNDYSGENTTSVGRITSSFGRSQTNFYGRMERSASLLFHLNERETRTELSIDDLVNQIADLRKKIHRPGAISYETIETNQQTELTDRLQKQISELATFVDTKVSTEDFEKETQSIRSVIASFSDSPRRDNTEGIAAIPANNKDGISAEILEQIDEIKASKLDGKVFEQQLELREAELKALLEQEFSKQQLIISSNTDKMDSELTEFRAMIDSNKDDISRLGAATTSEVASVPPKMPPSSFPDLDRKIQLATEAVRISMEESLTRRLDELKCIERELGGLTSKLKDKPSQHQIDSMLRDLESTMSERLGQDQTLQLIIENMKIGEHLSIALICQNIGSTLSKLTIMMHRAVTELKQRLTRGEVLNLIKNAFSEAKLGIQNTKDSLMVGRMPYKCLGCSQSFPSGVNGLRAPKVNHDSLPPFQPLVPNGRRERGTSLPSVRRSLRTLQTLRSVPLRPKTAIIGRVSTPSTFGSRNNSSS
jgi:hypothetical protein